MWFSWDLECWVLTVEGISTVKLVQFCTSSTNLRIHENCIVVLLSTYSRVWHTGFLIRLHDTLWCVLIITLQIDPHMKCRHNRQIKQKKKMHDLMVSLEQVPAAIIPYLVIQLLYNLCTYFNNLILPRPFDTYTKIALKRTQINWLKLKIKGTWR